MKTKPDWTKADEAFRRQVGIILGATGMTQLELALRLNISDQTLRARLKHPEKVTKGEERRLALVAKQNDLPYDAGLTL